MNSTRKACATSWGGPRSGGIPLTLYNLSLAFDHLSPKVFAGFGSDLLLWYPLPRRLAAMARFQRTHRRDREHHRATLDTIRVRYGIRCGPLEHLAGRH